MISRDEAFLILSKWGEDRSLLRAVFNRPGIRLEVECFFTNIDDSWANFAVGKTGHLHVWLGSEDTRFEYGEPRTETERQEIIFGATAPSTLIAVSKDETIILYEMIQSSD